MKLVFNQEIWKEINMIWNKRKAKIKYKETEWNVGMRDGRNVIEKNTIIICNKIRRDGMDWIEVEWKVRQRVLKKEDKEE